MEENYPLFDALAAYLSELPKASVKILNFPQYTKFLRTVTKLQAYMDTYNPCILIASEVDEELCYGCIRIEVDDLTILNPELFCEILSTASNFEIYPLQNGTIRMSIMFYSVLNPIY